MAVFRETPYDNCNFLVDLGQGDSGTVKAGFAEVTLPEAFIEVIEYRNGNDKESAVRKIPGRSYYTNCILKRGVIGALDLYEWWDQIRNGNLNARRTVVIQLLAEDRGNPVFTWKLLRAWPVRYKFTTLDACGNGPLLESLELATERLEVE